MGATIDWFKVGRPGKHELESPRNLNNRQPLCWPRRVGCWLYSVPSGANLFIFTSDSALPGFLSLPVGW